MKRWRLVLLAAVCVAGLQACDRQPPQTTVTTPGPSLPDDTVLRPGEGSPQSAATPPAASTSAPGVASAASAPQVASAASAPAQAASGPGEQQAEGTTQAAEPQTSAMGAPAANDGSASQPDAAAPGGEGAAAMTEMWRAFPPGGGAPATSAPSGNAAPSTSAAPAANAPPQQKVSSALPPVRDPGDPQGALLLAQRPLELPVVGVLPTALSDMFDQGRGQRKHEAIDIMAPAGTPVVAVDDGRIAKLFTSKPGGLTIYQFDPSARLAYYYAHLQGYAAGVREGMDVKRGDLIGYVGSTGNADAKAPHLHFAVFRLGTPPKWWQGEAVNPYPSLARSQPAQQVAAR